MFEKIKETISKLRKEIKGPRPLSKDEFLERLLDGSDMFIRKKSWAYKQLRLLHKHRAHPYPWTAQKIKLPVEIVERYYLMIEEGWSIE